MKKRHSTNWLRNILEFEVPSWNEVYSFLLNLAEAVRKSIFETTIIVGISRGGCLTARIMSDLLENQEIVNVVAKFYVGITETKGKSAIIQPISVSVKDKKVLVVDDVRDTGESLKLVNTHLREQGVSKIKIATIYYKPWSSLVPDYYEKETSCWLIFPWERKEAVRKTMAKFRSEEKTVEDTKEKLINSRMDRRFVTRFIKEIIEEVP